MARSGVLLTLLAVAIGCGPSVRPVFEVDDGGAVADGSSSDTSPPSDSTVPAGELGAPCKADVECKSGFCLSIGRCSKTCDMPGACPKSSNWTCVAIPGKGPMCDCDELSKVDVPCNGIDDNCSGIIDEGSTKCGDVCVNFQSDPKNCGGCGKACPAGANAEATCVDAKCGLQCASGFADCDGNPATGCEANLGSKSTCGKCDVACKTSESCVERKCVSAVGVDVMLLLGVTGSTRPYLDASIPALQTKLVEPLLGIPDVAVGVSYTCDFPVAPYGAPGDAAFIGRIDPRTSKDDIFTAISTYFKLNGGDAADGMVEALGTLAGLPIHPTSVALTCTSPTRIPGGCWRPGVARVIVLFTDDVFHNGPHPTMSGIYEPYSGLTPAAHEWAMVAKALTGASKTTVLFMSASPAPAVEPTAQYGKMLSDLGQPATDVYPSNGALVDSAAAAIVERVKTIRGL